MPNIFESMPYLVVIYSNLRQKIEEFLIAEDSKIAVLHGVLYPYCRKGGRYKRIVLEFSYQNPKMRY